MRARSALHLLCCAMLAPSARSASAADIAGVHLNVTSFYSTLHAADAGRWFVLFFSYNCGHCAAMLPAWRELQMQAGTSISRPVHLAAVDAEAEKALTDRLDVHGFPTLMAVEAGRLHEYDGGRSVEELLTFIQSDDLADVARGSRRLPTAPSPWDVVLIVPDALVDIVSYAVQTSTLAATLLAAGLVAIGVLGSRLTQPLDAPYLTVECPEGVRPGQNFAVEFMGGRTLLTPRGAKRRMQVVAPPGIVAGGTFFVPLVPPQKARKPAGEEPKKEK